MFLWLADMIRLDPVSARNVYILSLNWFTGAFVVLNSVFTLQPDNAERIRLEDTVAGSFKASQLLLSSATTFLFLGWLFGSSTLSTLADKEGRKIAYVIAAIALSCGMLIQILSWNIYVFIAGRFLSGFGVGGIGVITYVWGCEFMIVLDSLPRAVNGAFENVVTDEDVPIGTDDDQEQLSPKYHSKPETATTMNSSASSVFQILWSVGGVLLPGLALVIPNWRFLLSAVLLLCFLTGLLVFLTVPESPKWLLSKRRTSDYRRIMERHYGSIATDETDIYDQPEISETHNTPSMFGELFKPAVLMMTIAFAFVWFSNAFAYYGVLLNANKLPGNVFLITTIMNLLGIPAQFLAIPTEKRIGLDRSFVLTMLTSGVVFACMTVVSAVGQYDLIITLLSLLGTFLCALQFSLCYMVTFASYPTTIRTTGVGIGVTMGRLGAMSCPLVASIGSKPDGSMGYPALLLLSIVMMLSSVVAQLVSTRRKKIIQTPE